MCKSLQLSDWSAQKADGKWSWPSSLETRNTATWLWIHSHIECHFVLETLSLDICSFTTACRRAFYISQQFVVLGIYLNTTLIIRLTTLTIIYTSTFISRPLCRRPSSVFNSLGIGWHWSKAHLISARQFSYRHRQKSIWVFQSSHEPPSMQPPIASRKYRKNAVSKWVTRSSL